MNQNLLEVKARAATTSGRPPSLRTKAPAHVRKDSHSGYLFIAPQVIGFLIFVLTPLVTVFYYSLHNFNGFTGAMTFIGVGNFVELATDPVFAEVLSNTAFFSVGVIGATVVGGLGLALLLNQKLRGISVFRAAFFIPVIVSLAAWSLVWDYLLQAKGGVNSLLAVLGIEGPNWLQDPNWVMFAVTVVQVLKILGISVVLFLAALQDVPVEILEAARVDGASPLAVVRHITLPLVSPTILMVSILSTIYSLKAFTQVYLLTGGGPGYSSSVLGYYIYDQAFNAFQIGFASAAAVVMFVLVLGLTLLQWGARKWWTYNE